MIYLQDKLTGDNFIFPTPDNKKGEETLEYYVESKDFPDGVRVDIFFDFHGNEIKRKYIIPLGLTKKRWWQFWKKHTTKKTQEYLKSLMNNDKK